MAITAARNGWRRFRFDKRALFARRLDAIVRLLVFAPMDITTPNNLSSVCPDMVRAELKASQKRKRRARMADLKRRAQTKAPLFADEIIARGLAEKPDYYNAEITAKDIEIATLKVAERTCAKDKDFDPSAILYDVESDVEFSIRAIELRELAKRKLPAPIYYRGLAKALHYGYIADSPVYRADHWFNMLRYNGFADLAWSVHCQYGGLRPLALKPIQLKTQQLIFDFSA